MTQLLEVGLDDKYTRTEGRIFVTGIQALVRLPLMQRQRDQAVGLNTAGFITGYRAEINRHKTGLGVLAFVRLDADRNSGDVLQALENAIRTIPEVISCHYISGNGTFELQVVSRDLNTFSQFAREVLINLPNVKDLHTSFSLGEVKASSALPLGRLSPASSAATTTRSRS